MSKTKRRRQFQPLTLTEAMRMTGAETANGVTLQDRPAPRWYGYTPTRRKRLTLTL